MTIKNMDDFFEEIYGFKPSKRGAGYELLVGAVLKILNADASVSNNVFVESKYSNDKYQVDNLLGKEQENIFVEVKDSSEKVGRPDVTKLSGALLQLPLDKGIMATPKGYTKNAKQYVEDCAKNPNAKPIDLYIIRPSTEKDEEGRIKEIHIELFIETNDYANAVFTPLFAEGAFNIFQEMRYKEGDKASFPIDGFYRADGSVIETVHNLTSSLKADSNSGMYAGKWVFSEPTYIYCCNKLVPIKYVEYKIPTKLIKQKIVIKGKPLIYVRSNDGSVDKIITEEQFKNIKFEKDGS